MRERYELLMFRAIRAPMAELMRCRCYAQFRQQRYALLLPRRCFAAISTMSDDICRAPRRASTRADMLRDLCQRYAVLREQQTNMSHDFHAIYACCSPLAHARVILSSPMSYERRCRRRAAAARPFFAMPPVDVFMLPSRDVASVA